MMDVKRASHYVDYNFYAECYHGDVLNDSVFDKAELEAEAFIDEITFWTYTKIGRNSNFCEVRSVFST